MDFYDLRYKTAKGETKSMSEHKGKVVLLVNTATKCGLASQFEGLEELHQEFGDDGLVVLGFPCNQFMNQEPETNDTMELSCKMYFGVTFQLTEKVAVNGPDTHEVFKFLKKRLPGFPSNRIKWNFTKFLIDAEGNPVKRYPPTKAPSAIKKDIEQLLPNQVIIKWDLGSLYKNR